MIPIFKLPKFVDAVERIDRKPPVTYYYEENRQIGDKATTITVKSPYKLEYGKRGYILENIENLILQPMWNVVAYTGVSIQTHLKEHQFSFMPILIPSDDINKLEDVIFSNYISKEGGEIVVKLMNTAEKPIKLLAGTPIAEMLLVPTIKPIINYQKEDES